MRESRNRLGFALVIGLMAVLAFFVPAVFYFTELALRELRFMWWLILLFAGLIWLLTALGRKK